MNMDLNVRSDSVNVEQIMRQIRTRIREKRGADYTQAELQQLASAKLEQFADPSGLRSDLLEQFRKRGDEPSTYHRHRGMRRILLMIAHPILKRVQKQLMADLNLYFEIIHNLVVEVTRLGIEVQNLKMKVESLSSRVDFDERRGRALEGVVQYRQDTRPRAASGPPSSAGPTGYGAPNPGLAATTASGSPAAVSSGGQAAPVSSGVPSGAVGPAAPTGPGGVRPDGSRRRRRRRRRRPGHTLADSPNTGGQQQPGGPPSSASMAATDAGGDDDGPDDGPDDDDGAPGQ
jgi:hypothetical protein